jgi:hypothetical protein
MSAEQVDSYLRDLEEPKRATLEELRRTILEVVPGAEEVISYRVPAFSSARQGHRRVCGVQESPELLALQRLGPRPACQ